MLQLHGLRFHHPEGVLFDQLSIDLAAGLTIVRGGEGRGKTTLLRLLAGAEQAHGGTLTLHGQPCDTRSAAYQAQCYYVDPRTEAFDQLRVPDYFAAVRARFAGFDDAALPALIDGLALTPHYDKQLFMLSTGSKRKVYLAAAFAAGAAINLLDDPFAGLDKGSINFVCDTLNGLPTRVAIPQVWLASFYAVPAALNAVAVLDLGD